MRKMVMMLAAVAVMAMGIAMQVMASGTTDQSKIDSVVRSTMETSGNKYHLKEAIKYRDGTELRATEDGVNDGKSRTFVRLEIVTSPDGTVTRNESRSSLKVTTASNHGPLALEGLLDNHPGNHCTDGTSGRD
jgi:hypothetical protein